MNLKSEKKIQTKIFQMKKLKEDLDHQEEITTEMIEEEIETIEEEIEMIEVKLRLLSFDIDSELVCCQNG